MSHQAILNLSELRKAVRDWLRDEHTEHMDKDGCLRSVVDEATHNPADCLQCRVEDLLR